MWVHALVPNYEISEIRQRGGEGQKKNDEEAFIHQVQERSDASLYWKSTMILIN